MPNKVISYIFIFLATFMLFGHDFIPHTHGICHHSSCEELTSSSHDLFHSIQDVLGKGKDCSVKYESLKSFSFEQTVGIVTFLVFSYLFSKYQQKQSFFSKNEVLILKNSFFTNFFYRGPPTLF